jgi:hypothetical protein
MVYHEIAVEPSAVEDLKDLGMLEKIFGFEYGRLIAFLPAKPSGSGCWKSLFYSHLKSLLPTEKHKELELRVFRLMERAIFRSRNGTEITSGQNWCDLALKEHAQSPFAAILTAGNPADDALLPFQGLHNPNDVFPIFLREPAHFADSLKDPKVFLNALKPLITSAKRLDLIDPYFDPTHPDDTDSRRWKASVKHLAQFLRDANRLTIELHFHTLWDGVRDANDFVKSIAREIDELFPPTTILNITAWSHKHGGIRWHARYLITDKAGVALDYGTDMVPNRRTDITLLPRTAAESRRNEFNSNCPSAFEMEATIKVAGKR